jgi:hypothetical protein
VTMVIVHNDARPGRRGFRTRVAELPDDTIEVCDCGWSPGLGEHYREAERPFEMLQCAGCGRMLGKAPGPDACPECGGATFPFTVDPAQVREALGLERGQGR